MQQPGRVRDIFLSSFAHEIIVLHTQILSHLSFFLIFLFYYASINDTRKNIIPLTLLSLSNAIIFDASCGRKRHLYCQSDLNALFANSLFPAYEPLLRKGFHIAFTSADYAQAALAETTLKPGVNDVAGWLFDSSPNFTIAQSRLKNVRKIPSSFTYDSMLR